MGYGLIGRTVRRHRFWYRHGTVSHGINGLDIYDSHGFNETAWQITVGALPVSLIQISDSSAYNRLEHVVMLLRDGAPIMTGNRPPAK